jgi:hypothetical protein
VLFASVHFSDTSSFKTCEFSSSTIQVAESVKFIYSHIDSLVLTSDSKDSKKSAEFQGCTADSLISAVPMSFKPWEAHRHR